MSRAATARRLLALLRPMRGLVAFSVLCRLLNHGLGVAIPVVAAGALAGIATGGGPEPFPLALLLAALALTKGLFRYLEQLTGHAVAFRLLAEVRSRTFRSLVPLAPLEMHGDRGGDLVARVTGDVDRVEPFFAHTVAPLAAALLVPAATVVALGLVTTWPIALTLVPFLVGLLLVPWLGRERVAALAPALRAAAGETAAVLADASRGVSEIVVFDARQRVEDELDRVGAPAGEARRGLAGTAARRAGLGDLIAAGALVAVTAVAAAAVTAGAAGLDALAMALVAAWVVATPARAVEEIVPDLDAALAAAGRLFELDDRPALVPDPSPGGPAPEDGSFGFDAVTVHAAGGDAALSSLTAAVASGGLVALVGPSGAGKSTLVDLLARFRLPDAGTVTLGGADVAAIASPRLHRHVAVAGQRPDVFHGTVAENLRLADPAATDSELWAVLDRIGLADWVRSRDRELELQVGEAGDTMSGGQRRRLAVARALLRHAPLLILDEATSELDAASEEQVLRAVDHEIAAGATVLLVTHRLGPVAGAARILVLDRGHLVEDGTHDELLAAGGLYAGLWKRHLDSLEG